MSGSIETEGLTKRYGKLLAVDGANLSLGQNETLGFIGPNGAGKSTFMKMLLGIARPSSGSARVLGLDIRRYSVPIRRRVGYLPGDLGFYRNLTGGKFLEFCLSFYQQADRQQAKRLSDQFDLPLKKKVKDYSTGMRQKLGLIQAFSVGGDLLILDEPTKGLDPTSQVLVADMLAEQNRLGRGVLLSSHILEEVERICHRIVFIDRGRIIDPETISRTRDRFRHTLRVSFHEGAAPDLTGIESVTEVRREGPQFVLRVEGPVEPVLHALATLGVESLEYNRPSLVDIYRSLYLKGGSG
ncbi:MAG: ABC transporter ATP-binding protein [Planctomycetota bacterium]